MNIKTKERLIVALDVANINTAKALVRELGEAVLFYKVGLELFMTGNSRELILWLREQGKQVFIDLKFFDVPQTVASAVRQLDQYGASFATVHGNDAILEAAAKCGTKTKILAVTVLTSLDQQDMQHLGFQTDIASLVLSRARRALQVGCSGVIASGLEAADLRKVIGDKLIIICPGVRPGYNDRIDDQKRSVTVTEAFANGADYIVLGRPIKDAPSPRQAAERVQAEIEVFFSTAIGNN